jgi:predicted nucleic acid-binding protein
MSVYLDTSAMIYALERRLSPEGVTRPHTVAEFYGILTGRGIVRTKGGEQIRERLSPKDAVEAVGRVFAKVDFRELSSKETIEALPFAVKAEIQGATIHDFMHAEVAGLANCRAIVTANVKDFRRCTKKRLSEPEDYFRPPTAG